MDDRQKTVADSITGSNFSILGSFDFGVERMNEHDGKRALASVPGVLALVVWAIYLLIAVKNLPDLPNRVLISGSFGLLACLAVVFDYRHWRGAVLLASSVYLVTYVVLVARMTLTATETGMPFLSALSFYYGTAWALLTGIFQERGLMGVLEQVFIDYIMPILNVALIGMILMTRRPARAY